MSHHYSGSNFTFPRGDARLDFTDLFAFPKPGDSGKSILIMDAHPSFSVNPPGPTTDEPFAPGAIYEIMIDMNGDLIADAAFQVHIAAAGDGTQTAALRFLEGAEAARMGEGGQVIFNGVPVSYGREPYVVQSGDYHFFVGWRSDPFFFDAEGALNNLQFTGKDYFIDKDICSIALEVPNAILGTGKAGLWARTLVRANDAGGSWVQADRGARPSQTPFLTGDQNEAYRASQPADDARFIDAFGHSLEHFGGFSPEEARQVARKLLPDIQYYDPTRPASYPDNGRTLTDDVGDIFLAIATDGKVKSDGAGPHEDLLSEFPYLGPPHKLDRQNRPMHSMNTTRATP